MNSDRLEFIQNIIRELHNNGISDYYSCEFREYCMSADFSPCVIREDILEYVKYILDFFCY